MDNVTENRLRNLRNLVEQAGSKAQLARNHAGLDATYISQLLNRHRGFGEKAARKMESLLGKEEGWLDIDHSKPQFVTTSSPFRNVSINDFLSLTEEERNEIEYLIMFKLDRKKNLL